MASMTASDPSSGAAAIATRCANDALEYSEALSGWSIECAQLSAGRFHGELTQIRLGQLEVIHERTQQALMKRGTSWPNAVVFSLPMAASGNAWMSGRELPAASGLISDGNELPELFTPDKLDLICVAFDRLWFAAKALEFGYPRFAERVWRQESLVIPVEPLTRLRRLLSTMVREVRRRPHVVRFETSRGEMEASALQSLFVALSCSNVSNVDEQTPRKAVADRARDLALGRPLDPPSLGEICEKLGVSRRYLQNCFVESYGISASQLIRTIRLNGVRRQLQQAIREGRRPSIGDVAAAWGFWHWSRFAGEYREHFGELPSATVKSVMDA